MIELPTEALWLVIAFPLGGALLLHFAGRWLGEPRAGYLAGAASLAAFAVAAVAAIPFFTGEGQPSQSLLWEWMPAVGAAFEISWDPLSALMTLVVTGVGSLIHIYSVGYMHGDPRFSRFFTYLNLFTASMLTLVLAGNYAMLFVGWELVGLCSYLLISFWFTRPSAASAGMKAFVVNRIGDFGFLIALMLIFATFGTLSYSGVFDRAADELTGWVPTVIGLMLATGAIGKSAQIPLYVWLPDAMEGPTPVSALIHAATMVTAGVYVIARSSPIFEMAPVASGVVATVGALTALWAATIAIGQSDIKRVLAYSTISQLGYMFLAVGATAYVAGVFHLMTHAFFKALLFLAAGSVIHAMGGRQDMGEMGGLRKAMPVTFVTMGVGVVAIAGFPPLAGFWSKDEILSVVFNQGGWHTVLWLVGLITALLTAFYMFRQFVLVFLGKPRWPDGVTPHESPRSMTIPLIILAALSLAGGLINTPFRLGLEHFLEPSFEGVKLGHPPDGAGMILILAALSVAAGVVGAAMAFFAYHRPAEAWRRFQSGLGRVWGWWEDAYGVDDAYSAALVAPGRRLAEQTAFGVDVKLVDGAVNGVARIVQATGRFIRPAQSGLVRQYGLWFGLGLVAFLVWILVRGVA
jgi:NADH-quinone oxidoreductase subunit L